MMGKREGGYGGPVRKLGGRKGGNSTTTLWGGKFLREGSTRKKAKGEGKRGELGRGVYAIRDQFKKTY